MDDDSSLLDTNPIEFYLKKKTLKIDRTINRYLIISAAAVFIVAFILAVAVFWYVLRQDAMTPENYGYNKNMVMRDVSLNMATHMPRFQSKYQKNRLSQALLISIAPDKLVVFGDGKRTTVTIDNNFVVEKKGASLPIDVYQKNMDRFLSITRFSQLNVFFIQPDPFAHEPASFADLRVGATVNVIPTNDSPDGDVAKGQSIVLLN